MIFFQGTKEPFLFKAELISRAYSVNAPFLQCTKFFHTVSIGELLSKLDIYFCNNLIIVDTLI